MGTKKQLLLSIVLSSFLVSCGGESGKTPKNDTKSVNKQAQTSSNVSDKSVKTVYSTPEQEAFTRYEKYTKNLSEIKLGITKDGNSGKYAKTAKDYRRVKIPKDYGKNTVSLKGEVLTGIENSRICLDTNKNNLCDLYEPLALTDNDAKFTLKIKEEQKGKYNILAVRGLDYQANRYITSILRVKNDNTDLENVQIEPLSTLLSVNPGLDKAKAQKVIGDVFSKLKAYKNRILFQRTVDIITTSFNLKEDIAIVNKNIEVYKLLSENLGDDLSSTLDNISDTNVKKTVVALKNLIKKVDALELTDDLKESYAVVLDSKVQEAVEHFRNSSDDLELDVSNINKANLRKEAIEKRLEDIGVDPITDELVKAALDSDLKIRDLEDISKVRKVEGLETLEKQLNKKANATSELLILKSLLSGNKLEIYYSEDISEESKESLRDKNNIKKIYTIEGLDYKIQSSSWDDTGFKNTIIFERVEGKEGEKRLYINYLAIEDTHGKFTKEKPVYSSIEYPRSVPLTGQKKVWVEGDDGSFQYGSKISYKRETSTAGDVVWSGKSSNLMWQDAPYEKGVNDVITYDEAKKYCENLSYAGKSDWRMPNVKELVTTTSINMQEKGLFDNYSKSEISFSDSSQSSFLGDKVIGVDRNGRVTNLIDNQKDENIGEVEKYSVRCVRLLDKKKPSIYPDASFDNIVMYEKDKTSYDPSTGLMYQDNPFTDEEIAARKKVGEGKGFSEIENIGRFGDLAHAIKYCSDLNSKKFAGFTNWRLANVNEIFYSLNSKGSRTFQHRLEGFDYTLTSSSSLKDGARYPWYVGNFFNRKPVHNRSKGLFRCVRDMGEKELRKAKPINTKEKQKVKRKYVLGKKDVLNITLPASVFNKYEGIFLSAQEGASYLEDRQYEISQIIPKEELYPGYTIKSVSVDGKNICTPATKWIGISQRPGSYCEEKGLFRTFLDRELVLNSYGKSLLKEGNTYKIVISKRSDLPDFTINLTIGENDKIADNTSNTDTDDTTTTDGYSLKVSQPKNPNIEISVSSGYRLKGGTNILSSLEDIAEFKVIDLIDPDGKVFSCDNLPAGDEKDQCIKKRTNKIGSLGNFKIVSGDKNIFEVLNGLYSYLKVKNENLLALKVGKEYDLGIAVVDSKDKKIGETINIKVIVKPSIMETKDISTDVKDAVNFYGNKLKGTDEPILYTFVALKPHPKYKERLYPFVKTSATIEDIIFEMEDNDTYKLERFDINYSKQYAVILKDGKNPPASKTVKVTAKIPYKEAGSSEVKYTSSTFNLTITNTDTETYQSLQAKTKKDKGLSPIKQRPMPKDEIVKENLEVVLQDHKDDISTGKTYPSSRQLVLGKHFIKSEKGGLTGVEFEVVEGDGKEYFADKLEFYIDGYVLKFNKTNLPKAGDYKLKVQGKKDGMETNTATISFTIYPIEAPSVRSSVEANLSSRSTEAVALTKDGAKNVIPLFIIHSKSSLYDSLELLDREEPKNGSKYGNVKYNGCEVDNEIYKLDSSTDNKYYMRKVYRGFLSEPIYAIFLKAGKTAKEGDSLKVFVTGMFNGKAYPNEKPITINIKGDSYTNNSSKDYDDFKEDTTLKDNIVLNTSYELRRDDPLTLASDSFSIAEDRVISSSSPKKPYTVEIVGEYKDHFKVLASNSFGWDIKLIKGKVKAQKYKLQLRAKYEDSEKWSNICTVSFTVKN